MLYFFLFSVLCLISAVSAGNANGLAKKLACDAKMDWNPVVISGSFDDIEHASYQVCGDRVQAFISFHTTIQTGTTDQIVIEPPVGLVGRIPSSTGELHNHGVGDGINFDGVDVFKVDITAVSDSTCAGRSGLAPLGADQIALYTVDGGSAPRSFACAVHFEYVNIEGLTCP